MKKLALLLIIPFALLLGTQTASAQQSTAASKPMWNSFKPETLKGTISIVEPGKKSLFVSASNGVSFHFLVTGRTKIHINGTRSTIADLAQLAQKQATVTFVARPRGDVAQSITVSS